KRGASSSGVGSLARLTRGTRPTRARRVAGVTGGELGVATMGPVSFVVARFRREDTLPRARAPSPPAEAPRSRIPEWPSDNADGSGSLMAERADWESLRVARFDRAALQVPDQESESRPGAPWCRGGAACHITDCAAPPPPACQRTSPLPDG